jgi:hypothetical protein
MSNSTLKILPALIVAITAFSSAPQASAVPVTFSGGSGTPLTITLSEPVTYQITLAAPMDSAPFFALQDVTNSESGIGQFGLSGNVAFSINSGSHQSALSPSGAGGLMQLVAFGAQDVYLSGPLPGVNVNDTVIISAGTMTTLTPFSDPPPADGDFNTFIADTNGNRISNLITATVPDTGTTLSLFGLSLMGLAFLRRKLC